eukprot:GGOE01042578.1.p1 GENE.GGOE01042578.1~~GGOE01042578.1.p1  ORF type:complete len:930 (+),score=193.48 GGOE01042578.1:66-2855(+)
MILGELFFLVLCLGLSEAQYFRYGHIEWNRINTTNASQYLVQFSLKLGINDVNANLHLGDTYNFEGNLFQFGDNTTANLSSTILQYNTTGQWFFTFPVRIHEYSGPGPWIAKVESGANGRDPNIVSNGLYEFRLQSKVDMNNGNYFSPSITEVTEQRWFWNETDFKLVGFDGDGDTVSWRLSTLYEMGDTPRSTGYNQVSHQPYLLTVDNSTGQIHWTQARFLGSGRYQLQIMFMDGNGGEVPLDFILYNDVSTYTRPVIIGSPNVINPEDFLVNQQILFNITACDTTNEILTIGAFEPPTVMEPVNDLETSGLCALQSFIYTPTQAGYSRHCFYAFNAAQGVSQIYCFYFSATERPDVYTVWQAPTKQFTGWPIEAWFTGLYLSGDDRVHTIPDAADCTSLPAAAGVQVTYVYDQVYRTASGPRLNYRKARADVVARQVGLTKWCYKLNAGNGSSVELPWQTVRNNPVSFEVTDTGPYRITSLVSCPLYNKAFQYIIDGVNLVRFDRVYFLQPSSLPPDFSTITCEDLDPLDGTMINNFPVVDGLQPGFVSGSDRVEFPYKHSESQVGWYMCYKPFEQPWRMIKYIHPLQEVGIYGLASSQTVSSSQVNVTLMGLNLTGGDKWAVYPYRAVEDCSEMNWTNSTAAPVFPTGVSDTNFPSILVNSTSLPGINLVSICYQRNGQACKVAELSLKDQTYNYVGIPDPLSTTRQDGFVSFRPATAFVNESMIYEFTGYDPFGYILNDPCETTAAEIAMGHKCKGFQVKVAAHSSCEGNALGGEARYLSQDRRVIFRLQEAGLFRFCVMHRVDWEPVEDSVLIVDAPALLNSTAFYGYVNCDAYLSEYSRGACGCFLGGYTGEFVDVPTSFPVNTGQSSSLNFNQGCCAYPSANRTTVGADVKNGVSRPWGYCRYTPVAVPVPYPPFEVPATP